jgi:hypothetical protein
MRHAVSRCLEDELDAWVRQEFEAITFDRPPARRPLEAPPRSHPSQADPVDEIGEEPAQPMTTLLDEAETRFVEGSVAWLQGRDNADIILEEIWRMVVADRVDPGEHGGEAEPVQEPAVASERESEAPEAGVR